jgi:hypothetical protein
MLPPLVMVEQSTTPTRFPYVNDMDNYLISQAIGLVSFGRKKNEKKKSVYDSTLMRTVFTSL